MAQAEQFARNKFNDFKSLASNYSSNMSDWFQNHFLFEAEIRFDYGKQVALHGRVLGFDVLGGYSKGTRPIAQLEFGYKGGGYANIYDPVLHSTYNGITDPLRDSWNAGIVFFGAEGSYYPSNSLFGFENWKSESISYSAFNLTKLYNFQGQNYEMQYTGDLSFDLALYFGIHLNLRLGYYK